MPRILMTLMILPVLFSGCMKGDLDISIRYDQIHGLKAGDRLLFEENHAGNVKEVVYRPEGYYLVDVEIKAAFAGAATDHTKFYIGTDPLDTDRKAVEMALPQKGGAPLQDGATVRGSTMSAVFFGRLLESFEKKLEDLKLRYDDFSRTLREIPESREFRNLEKELERLASEVKRSGRDAREKIEKEILPRIRNEIEELRKRLRELGLDKDLKKLEDSLRGVKEI